MTEEELKLIETNGCSATLFAIYQMAREIRRLRSELAAERATHQELWQLVDRELDRIYCDARGIEHGK